MTEVEFVKNLLDSQWETDIENRDTDVPKPHFTLEKRERQSRLSSQDVGYVVSAENTDYTPLGFGWTHQNIDTAVAIEFRAATRDASPGYDNGYHRLFGKRNGDDGLEEPDRWDGIIGETTRIVLDDRAGRAEWNLIGEALSVADNADMGGKNYYRSDVIIPMVNLADPIDTST